MKAKVRLALPGFAGNMDDVVIYYNSKLNRLMVRKKVMPKKTPSNTDFAAASRQVRMLGISAGYIDDCRKYLNLYNRKNRRHERSMMSWTNVFICLMLKLKKANPGLNLATLTKTDIYANDYSCISVARAVQSGLLEKVNGWQLLANEI